VEVPKYKLKLPARRGAPYTYEEVELIYLTPSSKENAALLAELLERTPGAIDFAWRWCDADVERFPAKAFNRLYRLIRQVRGRLGIEARGCASDSSGKESGVA
jgi:hypothetical protein